MDHFKGINENERFNNELMQHTRKQTELLEKIAQLLQQPNKPNSRGKANESNNRS